MIIYLKTIQEFMGDDDDFHWNYGLALASLENYEQGEIYLNKI